MLNGKLLTPQMIGQLASKGIKGSKIGLFASAMSEGIVEGFLANNSVTTIDAGIAPAGMGVGTGKMSGLVPSSLLAMTMPALASEQILGSKSKDLAEAVTNALCLHFNQANMAMTTHSFVGVGAGIGKVIGLSSSAMALKVMQRMASQGIAGDKMQGLVKAICDSFSKNLMATAIVNVAIIGPPLLILGVPVPGGGIGRGKIL